MFFVHKIELTTKYTNIIVEVSVYRYTVVNDRNNLSTDKLFLHCFYPTAQTEGNVFSVPIEVRVCCYFPIVATGKI